MNPIISLALRVKARLLSPTLFNFYLRHLPKLLNSTASSADITPGEECINDLLYADDLVIFSKSATKAWKLVGVNCNLSVIMPIFFV